jgi:hypothetical protein
MVRRSRNIPVNGPAKRPVWHAIGAALGAFAMGVQLVLAGWLIAQSASAAPDLQADGQVICTHDAGVAASGGSDTPSAPASHGQCSVCVCLQSAKILAPPPEAPSVQVLRQRVTQTVAVFPPQSLPVLHVHSPYASRAPPVSA